MHYYDLPARMPAVSLLLEPRSLVVTTGEQYTARTHGIDAVVEDHVLVSELANAASCGAVLQTEDGGVVVLQRKTRYSLTCRDVARAAMKVGMGIGTRKAV